MHILSKKILKSIQAFTLLEIVATMAVVAVAMLGLLEMSIQGSKSTKSQNLDSDFSILESNVQTILSHDCKNALMGGGGVIYQPATGASHVDLTFPTLAAPSPVASEGYPLIGMQVQTLSLAPNPLTVTTVGTLTEYLVNFNLVAKKVSGTTSTAGILPGTQTFSKVIPLLIWVDNVGNKVVDCQTDAVPTALMSPGPTPQCLTLGVPMTYSMTNALSGTITASPSPAGPVPGGPWPAPSPSGIVTVTSTGASTVYYTLTVTSNSTKTATFTVPITFTCP